jgi:hypothetical protein
LALTELLLPVVMPDRLIYNSRPVYEVFKESEFNYEITIQEVQKIIKREKIKNYAIILGDSVGYSSPCQPENSLAYYLNNLAAKEGSDFKVFNLSAPSFVAGDMYTAIKLLDEYGISTRNLIINLCYWDFRVSCPTFWLKGYMRYYDPEGYDFMTRNLPRKDLGFFDEYKWNFTRSIFTNLSLFRYREFFSYSFKRRLNYTIGQKFPTDVRPWYEKSSLKDSIFQKANRWYYSDEPFTLDDGKVQVEYLDKIIQHQKGKNTLVFLAAMNDKLLGNETEKQGYIDNMKRIDDYFGKKDVAYINYNGKIDYNLFSDHVHLIEAGYRFLAENLWSNMLHEMEDGICCSIQ